MSDYKPTPFAGNPYSNPEDLQAVKPKGSGLLQDIIVQENLGHFVRERIPERVIHAKGSGAYGTFTVTHDISQYTKAHLFSKIGNTCQIFTRFSIMSGEKGSADTERDPRGFALKFYTEDGNWDLVGNNTPVFYIKDPKKLPAFIHSQKKLPKSNLKSATMMWDFWSFNPESLHQILMIMSDRGTPNGYRHMNGFGSHTYSMINEANERVWVKFHFKTKQGIKNFNHEDAKLMKGENPDFAQEDLIKALENKEFPTWTMYIQVMTDAQAKDFRWNPFDLTKVWFHDEFPLIEVGDMELNQIPSNYFDHVEQAAFSPSNLIKGISFSPDKMLQGRLLSYPDAHRYRLGSNSNLLEVNRCPFTPKNDQDKNSGFEDSANYYPDNFERIKPAGNYNNLQESLDSRQVATFNLNENEDDHFTQPGILYAKVMTDSARNSLIKNIITSMNRIEGPKKDEIINRQLCHFFRANIDLGMKVAQGLRVNIDANMMNHSPS